MKFHSLHLHHPRSEQDAARFRDRLDIALMFAALAAIIAFLIGGSRLVVALLAS